LNREGRPVQKIMNSQFTERLLSGYSGERPATQNYLSKLALQVFHLNKFKKTLIDLKYILGGLALPGLNHLPFYGVTES